jgi:hypothetical protein
MRPSWEMLIKEAFHSYQIYLQCSGVLDVHQAKLSLLLWPDVAYVALKMVDNPNDTTLETTLKIDLKKCVIEPIKIIHDSTMERVKAITGKFPIRSEEDAVNAKKLKYQNIQEAKRLLLDSINRMFVTLNTVTNIEYPVLFTEASNDQSGH